MLMAYCTSLKLSIDFLWYWSLEFHSAGEDTSLYLGCWCLKENSLAKEEMDVSTKDRSEEVHIRGFGLE